jgi:hypothetical protein
MTRDPLRDIQDEVAAFLKAETFLNDIPIITEQKGDILNQIDITLGKLGICVVVETLTGRPEHLGAGAYSLDIKVGITVTERVIINQGSTGTKKAASEVVAIILCLLNPSRARCPAHATSFDLVNDSAGLLIYQVNASATAGFQLT